MENKEFSYTYSSLSQSEKKQVENIKRQYGGMDTQKDSDLAELLKLDKKVKTIPKTIATIVVNLFKFFSAPFCDENI